MHNSFKHVSKCQDGSQMIFSSGLVVRFVHCRGGTEGGGHIPSLRQATHRLQYTSVGSQSEMMSLVHLVLCVLLEVYRL